jgi:ubiquinone/menaquinone biosynthesis C-methylase UbiE
MWRSSINDEVIALAAPAAGETCVDIGAGMGAGLRAGTGGGAKVVAVEPTPFMRRVLTIRRLGRRDRDRIEVVDGTAEHIPVDDGSVDAVWAVNTMHHWNDAATAIGEIARVLRPGGRIVLADELFDDPDHPEHDRFGSHGVEHHGFTMVDGDEMAALLTDAGFIDVEAGRRILDDCPTVVMTASAREHA